MAIIKKESLPLETQIRFLLSDLKRLSGKLDKIDKQLDGTKDQMLRDLIVDDLADNIIKYSKTSEETVSKLEEYFVWEEVNNLPRNFLFYKAYKQLTSKE